MSTVQRENMVAFYKSVLKGVGSRANGRKITDPLDNNKADLNKLLNKMYEDILESDDAEAKAYLLGEVITRKDIEKIRGLLVAEANLEHNITRQGTTITPLLLAVAVNDSEVNQLLKERLSEMQYQYFELQIKTLHVLTKVPQVVSGSGARDSFTSNMHKDPQIGTSAHPTPVGGGDQRVGDEENENKAKVSKTNGCTIC